MVTEAFSDFVVGHGELWCAQLFDATLRKMGVNSRFMDTRDVLVVTATSDGNSVDVEYEDSNVRLDRWAQKHGSPAVISLCLLLASVQGQSCHFSAIKVLVLCNWMKEKSARRGTKASTLTGGQSLAAMRHWN